MSHTHVQPDERKRPIPAWLVFVAAFLLISAIKSGQWLEPPYWDAAFSVFPAAITLAESNFNFAALYASPGFTEGGPNVHGFSLVTLVTAVVLRWTPSPEAAFLVLHFMNYLLAAITIACLYLLARPLLGTRQAILVALATLLFPLFLTQAGHLYLEIPSTCMAMLAICRFSAGKVIQASLWAAAAVWVKEASIIAAGSLALASLLLPNSITKRLALATLMSGPSMVAVVLHSAFYAESGRASESAIGEMLQAASYYLTLVPDLLALTSLGLAIGFTCLWTFTWKLNRISSVATNFPEDRLRLVLYSNIVIFFSFFVAIASLGWVYILPRYFVLALPILMLASVDTVNRVTTKYVAIAGTLLSILASIINYEGRLYPHIVSSGAIAERSNEYVDLLATHIDVARATESVAAETPVLFGRFHHYFVSYPTMGYVRKAISNGHFVDHPGSKYHSASLDELPKHFYLIIAYYGPNAIKNAAEADPRYEVTTHTFKHGHYASYLIEIRLRDLPKPN